MTVSEYRIYREIVRQLWNMTHAERVQLAKRAYVSQTTIWNWANGKVYAPNLATLTRVSRQLGYNITLEKT